MPFTTSPAFMLSFGPGALVSVQDTVGSRVCGVVMAIRQEGSEASWEAHPFAVSPGHAWVLLPPGPEWDNSRPLYAGPLRTYIREVPLDRVHGVDSSLQPLIRKNGGLNWLKAACSHLVATAVRNFLFEGRSFSKGDRGRVVDMKLLDGGFRVQVDWQSQRHWWVPGAGNLSFGPVDTSLTFQPREGDVHSEPLQTYKKGDTFSLSTPNSGWKTRSLLDGSICMLRTGTIVQALTDGASTNFVILSQPGNHVIEPISHVLRMTPFPHRFFRVGETVRVSESVSYRQRNLQGLSGTVLLCTDQDGDVGVEFSQDLKAGTLDGIGETGRCLYVPARTLCVAE